MLTDFFLKFGIVWLVWVPAVLLPAHVGADLDWWAPLSPPWKLAIGLTPPVGVVVVVAAVQAGVWLVRIPQRKRSSRARRELEEMRRERARRQAVEAASEGEGG